MVDFYERRDKTTRMLEKLFTVQESWTWYQLIGTLQSMEGVLGGGTYAKSWLNGKIATGEIEVDGDIFSKVKK